MALDRDDVKVVAKVVDRLVNDRIEQAKQEVIAQVYETFVPNMTTLNDNDQALGQSLSNLDVRLQRIEELLVQWTQPQVQQSPAPQQNMTPPLPDQQYATQQPIPQVTTVQDDQGRTWGLPAQQGDDEDDMSDAEIDALMRDSGVQVLPPRQGPPPPRKQALVKPPVGE